MGGNSIKEMGAGSVAKALCVNNTLRDLDMNSNEFGVYGALKIAEALKLNKSLKMLGTILIKISITTKYLMKVR